jgi:TPR repeat protein
VRHRDGPLAEAHALLQAAWRTADRRRHNKLLEWAIKVLTPLAEQGDGPAKWMLASIPVVKDKASSEQDFDRQHRRQAEEAARHGSAEAMFFLGCELDQHPTVAESSRYFREAAALGHTYAKWCHGLNLLSGRGVEKNDTQGLILIRQAAEEKFEGAIQFLSHAYAQGSYDFPKSAELAAEWWAKLKDKDVIPY